MRVVNQYLNTDYFRTNFDLRILKVLYSEYEVDFQHLSLVLAGHSCDIALGFHFKLGDRMLIAFDEPEDHRGAHYKGISFLACGTPWLKIAYGDVQGLISDDGEESMNYSLFKDNLEDICGVEILDQGDVTLKPSIASTNLTLENHLTETLEYVILDGSSATALKGNLEDKEEKIILVSDLSPGIYFVAIYYNNQIIVKRFIKP